MNALIFSFKNKVEEIFRSAKLEIQSIISALFIVFLNKFDNTLNLQVFFSCQ